MSMILLAAGTAPSFSFEGIVDNIFKEVGLFIAGDSGPFGMMIFAFLMAVHAILGGAELATGQRSRLLNGSFWTRFVVVVAILVSFDTLIAGFSQSIIRGSVDAIARATTTMWETWVSRCGDQLANAKKEIFTQSGGVSLLRFGVATFFELFISATGLVGCIAIGAICLTFTYFQAILGAAMGGFIVALGPICLPFAMHEATQDIALGYAKSWLVYSVFYMPLLVLAFTIAGSILSGLMSFSGGQAYTSVLDIFSHIINMVVGPIAALAIVMAAPALLKSAIR